MWLVPNSWKGVSLSILKMAIRPSFLLILLRVSLETCIGRGRKGRDYLKDVLSFKFDLIS